MSFPRYEAYKESGVEWLGEVPRHWEVKKLRRCLLEHRQGFYSPDSYVEVGVRLLRITDLYKFGEVDFSDCPRVEPSDALDPFLLQADDFVFARTGGAGTFGWVRSLSEPTIYASYLIRFRFANSARPCFLRHYFVTEGFQAELRRNIHGGVNQNVHAEDIKEQFIALPLIGEQTAIAAFLDRETAKIDGLVKEQQRLIALLKEKRQAVISHAVTKGLDPNAPMKDSGIEWLGDVPVHWEVMPLRYAGEALIGLTYSPDDVTDGEGILVLRSSNIQGGKISLGDCVYVSTPIPEKLRTRESDILICSRNGSRALIGKNARIGSLVAGATFGAFMTIFRSSANNFLYWVFNSSVFEFQSSTFLTATINQLTVGNLNSFEIPLAPPAERAAISNFLEKETARIDALVGEAENAIALLQERRSALISAAVTGKIDVRALAPAKAEAA